MYGCTDLLEGYPSFLTRLLGKAQIQAERESAASSQGINESANFRFLQRLSVIFSFRRDCPWCLASCRDYRPRKMASCRDCPCDSASCRDCPPSLGRKQNHTDSLPAVSAGSYLPSTAVSAGSKRSRTVSAEAKYDGQFLQEAKISGLVYTLWTWP